MKENKDTNQNGVIAEYQKALEVENVEELGEMNKGILSGTDIQKEWKESRVKLLHMDGRTDELKNFRPIAIISVICKGCMKTEREKEIMD